MISRANGNIHRQNKTLFTFGFRMQKRLYMWRVKGQKSQQNKQLHFTFGIFCLKQKKAISNCNVQCSFEDRTEASVFHFKLFHFYLLFLDNCNIHSSFEYWVFGAQWMNNIKEVLFYRKCAHLFSERINNLFLHLVDSSFTLSLFYSTKIHERIWHYYIANRWCMMVMERKIETGREMR